jgi:glycosyltransferase involved in cell wall biosynthesis
MIPFTDTGFSLTKGKPHILYVAYWGLREPLGRSLILPAVERLAGRGIDLTLITFEKPRDLGDGEGMAEYYRRLHAVGVRWKPLRYHKHPNIPATAFDVLQGALAALMGLTGGKPALIHARTFVGGVIGLVLSAVLGVPYIYHNEGFWPDQQIEGGFWPADGLLYRTIKRIERVLYERASGLVLLSERSRPIIERLPGVRRHRTPIAVVPSCVDLDRFKCAGGDCRGAPPRLIYIGSLGGRYHIGPIGGFMRAVLSLEPEARLEILSHSDPDMIRAGLTAARLPPEVWEVSTVPHEQVPAHLCRADAGIFFLSGGVGALSCSPTKVGEYLACGLPVVMSAGVGDLDEMVRARRVGVLVEDATEEALMTAAQRLLRLLRDAEVRSRCRAAAETHYSLEAGIDAQLALYERVARSNARPRIAE